MRKVCVISFIVSFFAFTGGKALSSCSITHHYCNHEAGTGITVQETAMLFPEVSGIANDVATGDGKNTVPQATAGAV